MKLVYSKRALADLDSSRPTTRLTPVPTIAESIGRQLLGELATSRDTQKQRHACPSVLKYVSRLLFAKAINLEIPQALLTKADEVIE
jgi:hypothetical protein